MENLSFLVPGAVSEGAWGAPGTVLGGVSRGVILGVVFECFEVSFLIIFCYILLLLSVMFYRNMTS